MTTAPAMQSGTNRVYGPPGGYSVACKEEQASACLPLPLFDASEPSDVLGMYMALMHEMARNGMDASEKKIEITREKIGEAMKELKQQLEEIARKLEEQKEDDGGWGFLGDVVDWVCDAVGTVFEAIGTGIEVMVDVARGPLDILVGMLKGGELLALLEQEVDDLTTRGDISKTIGEAAKGVARFVADAAKTVAEFYKAIATGENPLEALETLGKDLWGALKKDILENPAVMEVLGAVMKAVAIAAAVVTGGALGVVAVALFVISDLNKEYGIANEVFGKDAGPWVSMGIDIAASVCASVATLGANGLPELLADVQEGAAIVGGAIQVASGVNTIVNALEQRELNHMQIDAQRIMQRIATLQRFLETLLLDLRESTEGKDRTNERGARIGEIQGEGMQASVFLKG